ncbi:UrvD/REP family ATP-dependent DNA helicase [Leucobacter triazinivorans]|uniref:DNA 3'-5' helicase n=1 Tax=Leucobacter triazinivorans TaxID=1784719 RepID=A0A4P6KC07_9MICO|nr:UrvD/REP family ATP-dependent DNA helicase [Leucobacter triazinivorans]QBE47767.1 PD-(D/E)XK nuclease family protein [Leucobacter triazinivorans]
MTGFDRSQARALELDPTRHARVLGAPGSGKTRVLVEAYTRALRRPGWSEPDVLALAPNRLVATALRASVERNVGRAIGGTPVRTAASLGFAVLTRASALAGRDAPRLLTGTAQDEAIAAVVEAGLARPGATAARVAGLTGEVLRSPAFRAELRELWRIVDDFDLDAAPLAERLRGLREQAGGSASTRLPEPGVLDRWVDGLDLIAAVTGVLAGERPGELSSSGLLRAAAAAVGAEGAVRAEGAVAAEAGRIRLPRMILVDDAQELGEGELALLAACASAGSAVWVFGDPDIATSAFHGERTEALSRLGSELARRAGDAALRPESQVEQLAVLETVHRHGPAVRRFIAALTARVGAAGAGAQRAASSVDDGAGADASAAPRGADVQFAAAASPAEQLGIIAHRLRERRLGLRGAAPVAWRDMAVICRSRAEASRVARALAAHQVPTGVAAGGIVLREHQIVRELILLLQQVLGIREFTASDVLRLAGGVVGGLDPVAIRRLRGALLLQERREAEPDGREPQPIDEIVLEAFAVPGATPVIDSAGGRVLRRIGLLSAAASEVLRAGGTPREVLWALWERTRLAERWQDEALDGRGARADEAHRSLDAVMGLFFALQRHEEQDSEQPIAELLEDLLESAVPEDSLAQRSQRAAVTVTTPQGAIGREFDVVAVIGVQDGAWPNLRARGSLLGTAALERWLRGGEAVPPSRRDTMHDELRLFVHSCARSSDELLVVAITDEDQHPSPFFGFGRDHVRADLPSARLTLRGVTAEMRRRLASDPEDVAALRALVALAGEQAAGAHPDQWYGVLPPSTTAPLYDLAGDPELRVPVSPSHLERAENCPLDWAVATLSGGGSGGVQASLGTLVHHALETAQGHDPQELLDAVLREWRKLPFEAAWESERTARLAQAQTRGLAAYLRDFEASNRQLLGRETRFAVPIERAVLRGAADRIEAVPRADGGVEISVIDLKTGRNLPSKADAETHAQLQAYQLGVNRNAFELGTASVQPRPDGSGAQSPATATAPAAAAAAAPAPVSGGARLLYVHPDAAKQSEYVERVQQPISAEATEELMQRVAEIARVMAAGEFTARIEHHCSDPHRPGECRLHIIPAVSHA